MALNGFRNGRTVKSPESRASACSPADLPCSRPFYRNGTYLYLLPGVSGL